MASFGARIANVPRYPEMTLTPSSFKCAPVGYNRQTLMVCKSEEVIACHLTLSVTC